MKGNLFCFDILKTKSTFTHTGQTLLKDVQREDAERQIIYPSLFSVGAQKLAWCHWKQHFWKENSS